MTRGRITSLAVALLCLTSCDTRNYAKEYRPTKQAIAPEGSSLAVFDVNAFVQRFLASEKEGNIVYSPLGHALVTQLYEDELASVSSLLGSLNAKGGRFDLSTGAAVASTESVPEKDIARYNDAGVDVFIGDIPSLEKSLADHFGQDVKLGGNPGSYYCAALSVEERFGIPLSTMTLPFNERGSYTYAQGVWNGSYMTSEQGAVAEITIGYSSLRFYLPEPNKANPSFLFGELTDNGRISLTIPEFRLASKIYELEESGRYFAQDNEFEFNRYGIKGKSFSINGPTATDPSHGLELVLDRPFYFASLYRDVPLFLGYVASL